MIIDKFLMFADGLSLGSIGGDISGDILDFGRPSGRMADGNPLHLVVYVSEPVPQAGDATATITLLTGAADDAVTEKVLEFGPVKRAKDVGAAQFNFALPAGIDYKRYLGIKAVIAGVNVAGSMTAFMSGEAPGDWYPAKGAPR